MKSYSKALRDLVVLIDRNAADLPFLRRSLAAMADNADAAARLYEQWVIGAGTWTAARQRGSARTTSVATTTMAKLTAAQRLLLRLMSAGRRLWWYGDNGPELEGRPFWPQARTVRSLVKSGRLRWRPWRNNTQRDAGIRELEAVDV